MHIIFLSAGSKSAMDLAQSSPIVRSSISTDGSDCDYDFGVDGGGCQIQLVEQPPKKRQRLDHMTEQEKLFRRYHRAITQFFV